MTLVELAIVLGIVAVPGLIALAIVKLVDRDRPEPASAVAAGWYPDPEREGAGWRWHDGAAWTSYTDVDHPSGGRTE